MSSGWKFTEVLEQIANKIGLDNFNPETIESIFNPEAFALEFTDSKYEFSSDLTDFGMSEQNARNIWKLIKSYFFLYTSSDERSEMESHFAQYLNGAKLGDIIHFVHESSDFYNMPFANMLSEEILAIYEIDNSVLFDKMDDYVTSKIGQVLKHSQEDTSARFSKALELWSDIGISNTFYCKGHRIELENDAMFEYFDAIIIEFLDWINTGSLTDISPVITEIRKNTDIRYEPLLELLDAYQTQYKRLH